MPRKRGDGGVHGPDHLGAVHATKEAQGGETMQNEHRLTDWPERRGSELGVLVKHVLGNSTCQWQRTALMGKPEIAQQQKASMVSVKEAPQHRQEVVMRCSVGTFETEVADTGGGVPPSCTDVTGCSATSLGLKQSPKCRRQST